MSCVIYVFKKNRKYAAVEEDEFYLYRDKKKYKHIATISSALWLTHFLNSKTRDAMIKDLENEPNS